MYMCVCVYMYVYVFVCVYLNGSHVSVEGCVFDDIPW